MNLRRFLAPLFVIGLIPTPAFADLEVGFVIDTTGSMGGEIREAKERVLDLARDLAKARPNEVLRLGVVAFRDKGDDYLTEFSPLSNDLAVTQAFLDSLAADGGGDTPEHVLAGLDVALESLGFTAQSGTEKQLFLIGDAAPQLGYQDGISLDSVIDKARSRGVAINAIGCRSLDPSGISAFQRIAYSTEGRYQHIGGIRGESSSLAEAVRDMVGTETVLRQPIAATMERVAKDLSRGERFEASLHRTEGRCAVELHLPEGLQLTEPPEIAWAEDHLEAIVSLRPGRGETVRLLLAACPAPSAHRVEIHVGGAS